MEITLSKTDLASKVKIRNRLASYLSSFSKLSDYSREDVFSLVLSAIRAREDDIVTIQKKGNREKYALNTEGVEAWIKEKVIPNTVSIKADDTELLKLLVFSLAMPYKKLTGETNTAMSGKVREGNGRYFGQILSDTFIGKIGEVAFKKFAGQNFDKDISLDWEIGRDRDTFKSDIVGSKKIVSIKSTDTLESIWAEAPPDADYGIFVKVAIPKDFFMKILAHISSLRKLLRFVEERLDKNDSINELLKFVENTAYGEEMTVRAYVCGFFETSIDTIRHNGQELPFLGGVFEVFGEKHMMVCSGLKHSVTQWRDFFPKI